MYNPADKLRLLNNSIILYITRLAYQRLADCGEDIAVNKQALNEIIPGATCTSLAPMVFKFDDCESLIKFNGEMFELYG